MPEPQLVIRNGTVFRGGQPERLDIGVRDGRITEFGDALRGKREIDATECWVLPGVVDVHTHMALPVRGLRSGDDFDSGSKAAAFGGVGVLMGIGVL